MSELRMTQDEFRTYVDEAFLNGTKATLDAMATFVAEFKARAEATTPGDLDLTTHDQPEEGDR